MLRFEIKSQQSKRGITWSYYLSNKNIYYFLIITHADDGNAIKKFRYKCILSTINLWKTYILKIILKYNEPFLNI